MLELTNITKRFGGLQAVNDLSFQVHEGEIVSLIGPNGAGKTTVMNLITGIYAPTGGDIRFDGASIVGLPPGACGTAGASVAVHPLSVDYQWQSDGERSFGLLGGAGYVAIRGW